VPFWDGSLSKNRAALGTGSIDGGTWFMLVRRPRWRPTGGLEVGETILGAVRSYLAQEIGGRYKILASRRSGGSVLEVIQCPAHRDGQKVRWPVWGVWFGSVRLPGDSICEAAHGVGGSTVGWSSDRHWGKNGWAWAVAYLMKE
jgi:hypothetical protein